MKWKRTSSEKIAQVITAKIANPDLSSRDIEKQIGDVDHSTVTRIIDKDLQQVATLSTKTRDLYDINLDIIITASEKVSTAMKFMSPEKISEAKDMQSIVETAFKQNQLLQGKDTEKQTLTIQWLT